MLQEFHIETVYMNTALKRHPTGSSFLSCSLDGTVRVWDLETLTVVRRNKFLMCLDRLMYAYMYRLLVYIYLFLPTLLYCSLYV